MATMDQQGTTEPLPSVLTVANVVYALHTLAIVVGIAGSATVVGSFIGSVPSIVAVILNYVKRGDARGTWVESHYRWQIRTFWFALLWFVIAVLVIVVLGLVLIGIPLGFAILAALTVWLIYRIARGWLRLRDRRPMYV
jgi:uncharacterized membrane protein